MAKPSPKSVPKGEKKAIFKNDKNNPMSFFRKPWQVIGDCDDCVVAEFDRYEEALRYARTRGYSDVEITREQLQQMRRWFVPRQKRKEHAWYPPHFSGQGHVLFSVTL